MYLFHFFPFCTKTQNLFFVPVPVGRFPQWYIFQFFYFGTKCRAGQQTLSCLFCLLFFWFASVLVRYLFGICSVFQLVVSKHSRTSPEEGCLKTQLCSVKWGFLFNIMLRGELQGLGQALCLHEAEGLLRQDVLLIKSTLCEEELTGTWKFCQHLLYDGS
jgi:hypothetical protein